MRRRTRVLIGAASICFILTLAVHTPASSDTYALTNGGFEAGATGWAPPTGATLTVAASPAPAEGANAAHLTATGAGTMTLASQYWTSPDATPTWTYALAASVIDNDPKTSNVTARIAILSATEQILAEVIATLGSGDATAYRTITTAAVTAPAGAKYLRVTFSAQASGAGARLSVDAVRITTTPPPPSPTPIPTPLAPPPPVEEPPGPLPLAAVTATPTATPRATSTPRTTATPRVTPTPTSTPAPATALRNANFDQGVAGWSVSRGRLRVAALLAGQGDSLVLTADDTATIWVQQTVSITPGGWFSASALLAPLGGTEAAWLRIAWYASVDGSGSQLRVDDSPAVSAPAPNAMTNLVSAYEVVSTGPVRAPDDAHSARVRILLRATDERGASLLIDDVTFEVATPPEVVVPGPSPAARTRTTPVDVPTPAPAAPAQPTTPVLPAPATAPSMPTPAPGGQPVAQRSLRITEFMSNPAEAGDDAAFEWVEVMNTGAEPARLLGLTIRDRRAGSTLPDYTLNPGAVVVIAAAGARLPDGTPLVRLRGFIGNGLGNAGDRIALVVSDGREIDAVAYGVDTEDGETAAPAPGPAQSVERVFSSTGTLLETRIADRPTPGIPPAPTAARAAPTAVPRRPAVAPAGFEGFSPAWAVLVTLAGGLLLGVAGAHTVAVLRGRDIQT